MPILRTDRCRSLDGPIEGQGRQPRRRVDGPLSQGKPSTRSTESGAPMIGKVCVADAVCRRWWYVTTFTIAIRNFFQPRVRFPQMNVAKSRRRSRDHARCVYAVLGDPAPEKYSFITRVHCYCGLDWTGLQTLRA
jgi:hypothetical protein